MSATPYDLRPVEPEPTAPSVGQQPSSSTEKAREALAPGSYCMSCGRVADNELAGSTKRAPGNAPEMSESRPAPLSAPSLPPSLDELMRLASVVSARWNAHLCAAPGAVGNHKAALAKYLESCDALRNALSSLLSRLTRVETELRAAQQERDEAQGVAFKLRGEQYIAYVHERRLRNEFYLNPKQWQMSNRLPWEAIDTQKETEA